MKKNGQYVGVDEKFIPEEEKYVENDTGDEVTDDIHGMYKGVKEYVSNKDNQKKMKNVGVKGLKIAKGVAIGNLVFIGFIILMSIVVFVLVISRFIKTNKQVDIVSKKMNDEATTINNKIDDQQDEFDVNRFNIGIETHSGTQKGFIVTSVLDTVVTRMKENANRLITVIYNSTITSNTDEITLLKKQFDATAEYEISIDYDSNGFVNKITISNY